MPVSAATTYIPAFIVFVLLLAAACLSNLGVSLYSTGRSVSHVHVHGSLSGDDNSFASNNNKTFSVLTTATTSASTISSTTPTLYPPSQQQAATPIAKGYDDYWLVASPQREVLVNIIPKVMCSSIRRAMNDIECNRTHNPNERCAEARKSELVHNLYPTFANFTRVVFYRDPIERALSTYYNSETNRYIFVKGCTTWKNCTFDYWVKQLAPYRSVSQRKYQGRSMNEHFLKQTVISQRQKMHYHYRLRMTNKDHTNFFFEQLLKTKPQSVNQSSNSKTKTSNTTNDASDAKAYIAKKFQQVSTDALTRLLFIYEDDFQLWEDMVASSPKGPNEYTMYDYYKEHFEAEVRPKVEQLKKKISTAGGK